MISILTPTRGRPELADRFTQSVMETAAIPEEIELLFYVDRDDPRLEDYATWYLHTPYNIKMIIGEPMPTSHSWNKLAAASNGEILIMGGDDAIYRTPLWDQVLLKRIHQYEDNIYVAYFEDGINGESLAAFPIVSRLWYKTLGYFTAEIFHFLYTDTWIYDIGKRLDRLVFIPEVLCEHMHFSTGKMKADETTIRPRSGNYMEHDKQTFENSGSTRELEANKLREVMK